MKRYRHILVVAVIADLYSVPEAADALGVNEARIRAMIRDDLLEASKVSGRWLIPRAAIERRRRIAPGRGRPLRAGTAWKMLADRSFAVEIVQASPHERDRWRRKLSIRAEVVSGYAHPALLKRLLGSADTSTLPAGRALADAAGVPAGARSDFVDIYASASSPLFNDRSVDWRAATTNIRLRVVDVDMWPPPLEARTARLLVAWCDLADDDDRAADMVLDSLATEVRTDLSASRVRS